VTEAAAGVTAPVGDKNPSSLLKRAKAAETSVDKLKKQIAFILTATGANEEAPDGSGMVAVGGGDAGVHPDGTAVVSAGAREGASGAADGTALAIPAGGGGLKPPSGLIAKPRLAVGGAKPAAAGGAAGGGGGGADPAELRKLQRRIKELEAQMQAKAAEIRERHKGKKIIVGVDVPPPVWRQSKAGRL
jgi:hypothetical protein